MYDEAKVKQIETKLSGMLEVNLFNSAIASLNTDSPLKITHFAFDLRELLRIVLARLADDDSVMECIWYENQLQNRQGVTRGQRIRYAIKGGFLDDFVKNKLMIEIDDITTEMIEIMDQLNKYTHVTNDTFNVASDECDRLVSDVIDILITFFDRIDRAQNKIMDSYIEKIRSGSLEAVLSTTISEIDELATHYLVENVYIYSIDIDDIDTEDIIIKAFGYIEVELQYGSDGDYRRGDGVRLNDDYPFEAIVHSNIMDPLSFSIEADDIKLDLSSFYK
jgi:hypothetical protein